MFGRAQDNMQKMTKTYQEKRCPVLVVGIGNILLADEGVGPHVIRALENVDLPPSVELLDGGTAGADLIDQICDRQKVIFIDAVEADAEPGSILRMTAGQLTANLCRSVSLHEFGLVETVIMAEQLGCAPKEVVILGVKPKDVSCGLELSQEVAAAVPKVVELILAELSE
jgi:hydrogenase maturation protease